MDHPLIMHCNYAEQGQSIEQMCALAGRLGFDGIEFRRQRDNLDEKPQAYLDQIAHGVQTHNIKHVLFGAPGPNLVQPDADARRHELDKCIAFYRMAGERFDLTVCNAMTGSLAQPGMPYTRFEEHGSNIATDAQRDAVTDGYRVLAEVADELDMRFAFETHNVYLHDLPAPTRELIDRISHPRIGVNLDYGNILLHPQGPDIEETFRTLSGHIFLLHLKNMLLIPQRAHDRKIPCRLGDGAINNRQLLRLAMAHGFDGPIVIEAPQPGDRERFAKVDLAYLRELMAELGG